jgi:excisionase family DNA binding protein
MSAAKLETTNRDKGEATDAVGERQRQDDEDREDREVLTVDEVAELLRVNRKTVYAAIKLGEIPGARRIGGAIRLHRTTVLTWLAAGQGRVSRGRR